MENQSRPRRMPPYRLIRDFLPPPLPAALFDWAIDNEAQFKPTMVGSGLGERHEPTHRQSVSVRDFGPLRETLRQRALEIAPSLIDEFGVSPSVVGSVELELVAHNEGAFLKRHIDTFTGSGWDTHATRLLSAVYYLHRAPKAFSGGCLRLFPLGFGGREADDRYLDVEPEHNMLVVFPSWVEHEVRPIACPSRQFADSRFSINIWLRAAAPTDAPASSKDESFGHDVRSY